MPAKDAPIRDAINKAIDGRKRGRKKVIALVRRKHEYSKSRIRRVYEQSGLSLLSPPWSVSSPTSILFFLGIVIKSDTTIWVAGGDNDHGPKMNHGSGKMKSFNPEILRILIQTNII
jgi:hypothetical protein